MKNFRHPSNNRLVGAPTTWHDPSGALELKAIDATEVELNGHRAFVTWWEPSSDELAMLISGGRLQLTCIGGQPAINLCAVPGTQQGLIVPGSSQ